MGHSKARRRRDDEEREQRRGKKKRSTQRDEEDRREHREVQRKDRDSEDDDDADFIYVEDKEDRISNRERKRMKKTTNRHSNNDDNPEDKEDRQGRRKSKREEKTTDRDSEDDDDDDDYVYVEDKEDRQGQGRRKSKEKSSSRKRSHRDDGTADDSDHDAKRTKKRDKKSETKKRSKKERSSRDERNDGNIKKLKVDKSKLFSLGEPLGRSPDTLLDAETDYFAYHKHLWLYLYRDCSTAFNDLSSQQARRAFADFVQRYNAGELELGYYAPNNILPVEALEECKTTRHSWGLKISDQEDKRLQVLQEGVHKQTEYQAPGGGGGGESFLSAVAGASMPPPDSRPAVLPREDDNEDRKVSSSRNHHHSRQTPEERQANLRHNRRLRDHVQTVQEELTGGRKEGRERQLEQRRELSAKIHGAQRGGEQDAELNDEALYGGGGGDADFRRALAASQQRTAANEGRKQARVAELQQKEQEKQNAMLQSLGLSHKIGQKIQIQPRPDS